MHWESRGRLISVALWPVWSTWQVLEGQGYIVRACFKERKKNKEREKHIVRENQREKEGKNVQ